MHFHTNRSEHFESQNYKDYSYSQQNMLVSGLTPTLHTGSTHHRETYKHL